MTRSAATLATVAKSAIVILEGVGLRLLRRDRPALGPRGGECLFAKRRKGLGQASLPLQPHVWSMHRPEALLLRDLCRDQPHTELGD